MLDAAAAEVETDTAAAREKLLQYMEYNGRDVYDLLVGFVAENDIPKAMGASCAAGERTMQRIGVC